MHPTSFFSPGLFSHLLHPTSFFSPGLWALAFSYPIFYHQDPLLLSSTFFSPGLWALASHFFFFHFGCSCSPPILFYLAISYVDQNMTWIHLDSTYDLFINGLVVSGLWVMSDFATRDFLCEIWLGTVESEIFSQWIFSYLNKNLLFKEFCGMSFLYV